MNILHMKYAAEVARVGSLSKASENLLIAQPNISRSIKELEADMGIMIFERTQKGMVLTPEGEQFIVYAKSILDQIEQVERIYKNSSPKKQKFSISAPHASYISEAFAYFSADLDGDSTEIYYKETNSQITINEVVSNVSKLGIVRYSENYDKFFKAMLEEKGLGYELVTEFSYMLLMSSDNPLSEQENITASQLSDYVEIVHADPYIPTPSVIKAAKEELPGSKDRRIFIFDRASQFDLLSVNHETFMWVSPVPDCTLERYNLVQKKCADSSKVYKDVLIYRNGYKFSAIDKKFITELCNSKRKYIK